MDGTEGHCIEWWHPDIEGQMTHILTHLWKLESRSHGKMEWNGGLWTMKEGF
jgi:hypothetical protein